MTALQTLTPTRRPRLQKITSLKSKRALVERAIIQRIQPERLQVTEDRLLHEAIQNHPSLNESLDRALDGIAALSAEVRHSRRAPLMLQSATELGRVEDLLLEAIVRTHPQREHALDRLLDAVVGEDPAAAEARERAEFDMRVDNDFDGMS